MESEITGLIRNFIITYFNRFSLPTVLERLKKRPEQERNEIIYYNCLPPKPCPENFFLKE